MMLLINNNPLSFFRVLYCTIGAQLIEQGQTEHQYHEFYLGLCTHHAPPLAQWSDADQAFKQLLWFGTNHMQ
jgi:hypothetical protein